MKKILGLVMVTVALTCLMSCVSTAEKQAKKERAAALEALKPVRTIPEKRLSWVDSVPNTKSELAFIGVSNQYATEAEARNEAQRDGRYQLVNYYGTLMSDAGRTAKGTSGLTSDVFDPEVKSQELKEYLSSGIASKISAKEYYTEIYLTTENKYAYKVFALMGIEKSVADKAVEDFMKQQADSYKKQAAAEKDAAKRKQLEEAAEWFGGSLESNIFSD